MEHVQELRHLTLGAENDWMRSRVAHLDSVEEAVAGHFEVAPVTEDRMEIPNVAECAPSHRSFFLSTRQ
jgi:hypothetical protein